jgi:hypothetical protein
MGRLANVGSMVPAGAGVLGMIMSPSQTPGTDVGATAAEMGMNLLTKGTGGTISKLARMVGVPSAVAIGSYLGNKGDQATGFTTDTDWGKIGVYTAGSSLATILGSFSRESSPAAQQATKLQGQTGVDFPLNLNEQTGTFGKMTKFFGRGSAAEGQLGVDQSQAAKNAVDAIIGTPMSTIKENLADAVKYQRNVKEDVLGDWMKDWNAAEAKKPGQMLSNSQIAKKNAIGATTSDITGNSPEQQFGKAFNLNQDQLTSFLSAVNADPEKWIVQFNQASSDNLLQGSIRLGAVIRTMEKSGLATEAAKLSQAAVMQDLYKTMSAPVVNGQQLASQIRDTATHLKIALPPDKVDALNTLADIVEVANPAEKVAGAESKGAGALKYLGNKLIFESASMAAGAAGGSKIGAKNLGTMVIGGAAGVAIAVPLYGTIGKILENPDVGKLFLAASKGDSTAATKIARTFTSNKIKEEVPKNPLSGMFGQ